MNALEEVRLMDKKGQGISLNVIIIAAIALLVLVILSVIFMGRMGVFGEKSKDCQTQGGKCAAVNSNCGEGDTADYPTPYSAWDCPNTGETCCIKIS
jgi:hypothetical protein